MSDLIVLINPYFRENDPVPKVFPPLGIASLSAQMKELGLNVWPCDCTFRSPKEVVEEIGRRQPALIGIYVMVSYSRSARQLLQELRPRLPHTLFVAGGPLPTLYPEQFVPEFDLVFRGECDVHFPRFCREYIANGKTLRALDRMNAGEYPGLYGRIREQEVSISPCHYPAAVLEKLPLPDRSWMDHARYQQVWEEHTGCKCSNIIITRGCPFQCDFCSKPIWGSLFRKPKLEQIFADMGQIIRLGYNRLWIADDSFTLDLQFLEHFCREKNERGLDISWSCLSRVDKVTPEMVAVMKEAGCSKVYLGLESGSDRTLQLMKKRIQVADIMKAVHLYHRGGIATAGFFIVGYPGETVASVEKTFSLALSLPLDEISFNLPLPLPGSPLFNRVPGLHKGEDWDHASEARFIYRSEFDPRWLKTRIEVTMDRFRSQKNQRLSQPCRPPRKGPYTANRSHKT